MDWAKGAKEADDEAVVSKTGAKTGMARLDWSKPLHESGRSLFGGVQEADGEERLGERGAERNPVIHLPFRLICLVASKLTFARNFTTTS